MHKFRVAFWMLLLIIVALKAYSSNSYSTSDSTKNGSASLQSTDASVDIMDSMLTALYSTNPAWRFDEEKYNILGFLETDTPRYSPSVYIERINNISSSIPYTYNDQVQAFIKLYTEKRRDKVSRMLGLSQQYFPMFEEELDKNGMPLELKYLPVIESALNTTAVSRAGATGLWQIMYGTGKLLGLKIDTYIDERRDPHMATIAAVNYLKELYGIYDDWLLAIAAYNCGPGNVNKALRRAGGGEKTFWDIEEYLPAETRGYVPAFIAATYTFEYHKEHNIKPAQFGYRYDMVDTIMITKKLKLEQLAPFINMSKEDIAIYNPALKTNTIPGYPVPFPLRLPVNAIALYYANQESLFASLDKPAAIPDNSTASSTEIKSTDVQITSTVPVKVYYTVKKGDNLGYISDWFDCTITDIKKWNAMKSTKIVPGQKLNLMVPANKQAEYAQINKMTMSQKQKLTGVEIVGQPKEKTADQPSFIFYTVRPGDTLWSIAQKYPENSIQQIRDLNDIAKNETLKAGAKIKLVK